MATAVVQATSALCRWRQGVAAALHAAGYHASPAECTASCMQSAAAVSTAVCRQHISLLSAQLHAVSQHTHRRPHPSHLSMPMKARRLRSLLSACRTSGRADTSGPSPLCCCCLAAALLRLLLPLGPTLLLLLLEAAAFGACLGSSAWLPVRSVMVSAAMMLSMQSSAKQGGSSMITLVVG